MATLTIPTSSYDFNCTVYHEFIYYTIPYHCSCGSSLSIMVAAILVILLLISVVIHLVVVVFYCFKKKCGPQKVQSDINQQIEENVGRDGAEGITYDIVCNEARVTAPVMKQNDAYGRMTGQK